MSKTFTFAAAFVAGSIMVAANADVIGRAVSLDPDLFTSYNFDEDGDSFPNHDANVTDNGFDDGDIWPEFYVPIDPNTNLPAVDEFGAPDYRGGDMFGIGRKPADYADNSEINGGLGIAGGLGQDYYPFAIVDDSASFFPGDTQGIIRSGDDLATPSPIAPDTAPFFGVVDTVNGGVTGGIGSDTQQASWTFDISGSVDLAISIDMAAMGDFELPGSSDVYLFEVSIDGGTPVTLFQPLAADTVDDFAYDPLEGGAVTLLDDPLVLNGTTLTNTFQTFNAAIAGTGSELKLTFTANTAGGAEAFVFRNVILEDDVAPTGTIAGDFNGDGTVDAADYTLWADNEGQSDESAFALGSGNGGGIDGTDYTLWRDNFGNSAAPLLGGGGGAVPEPTTLLSAALALGLGVVLRKRIG